MGQIVNYVDIIVFDLYEFLFHAACLIPVRYGRDSYDLGNVKLSLVQVIELLEIIDIIYPDGMILNHAVNPPIMTHFGKNPEKKDQREDCPESDQFIFFRPFHKCKNNKI